MEEAMKALDPSLDYVEFLAPPQMHEIFKLKEQRQYNLR